MTDYKNLTDTELLQIIDDFIFFCAKVKLEGFAPSLLTEAARRLRAVVEETPYYTTAEAAKFLSLNPATVTRYGREGMLTKTGKRTAGSGRAELWLKWEVKELRTICQECKETVKMQHSILQQETKIIPNPGAVLARQP